MRGRGARRINGGMTTDAQTVALARTNQAPRMHYADLTGWQRYETFFPERMRMTAETPVREEWWQWNGLDVHLDRLAVPESPLKVIVLHGAGAYGRVMSPAAVLARKHGWETVSPDLPGYGLTKVPRDRFVFSLWVDCMVDFIEAEIARDGRPVVLFGVSLGGLLAYHAAARSKRVVGLVATMLTDARETEVRKGLARLEMLGTAGLWLLESLSAVTDGLPMPMRYMTRMNRISNKPELASLCSNDPLGGGNWVPARFLRTLMGTAPDIEPEDFRVCPVLLTHPGVDHMTDISLSRRFFDRLAGPKKMVVLEGASHMPTEHPGIDQMEHAVVEFAKGIEKDVLQQRGTS
jgi:alpha-beta hydrolase superfamily lysophospholipase